MVLSKDGLKAGKKRWKQSSPTNKGELESFLGMLNYLSAFAPNFSNLCDNITPA